MEKETKYCITIIIVAAIWLLGQPISGNMSIEANFDRLPYFNLTNSSVSGSAEVSGSMPVGIILPMFVSDIVSYTSSDDILILYFLVLASIFLIFVTYAIYKNWRK